MILPTLNLELHRDMNANWDYFSETFESHAILMGYRSRANNSLENKLSLPK